MIPVEDDVPGDAEAATAESYLLEAGACRSAAVTASTVRSRSTAAASSPTTAARRCSSTSTATRPPKATLSLVLMGVKMMRVRDEPYLRQAGMLPERERMIAFEAADVTIAPSPDDLLAQSVLESLAVGTPVLASARNAAAVEHCRRANARPVLREPRRVRGVLRG